jgi:hypothetical protein
MKSRIYISTPDEHQLTMESLLDRALAKDPLSIMETEIFCTRLTRESRATFSICDEYRFRDYYFSSFSYGTIPEHLKLSEAQKDELNHFADDWYENVILVQNHKSLVLQQIAKEARREIKQMEKEFSHNGFLVRNFLYKARLRKISWMSRFINFKIFHEYFLGYQNNQVVIPSMFGDVIFNEVSLAHIYTRHFAAGEKQYVPDQSFFINDFHFNSIHRLILLVLSWIGKENIAINHPFGRAITFKYKAAYYQLYIDKSFMQIKGKGNVEYLVVKSLFPVNNKDILNQIEQQVPHKVSGDLTIYEQFELKGV